MAEKRNRQKKQKKKVVVIARGKYRGRKKMLTQRGIVIYLTKPSKPITVHKPNISERESEERESSFTIR